MKLQTLFIGVQNSNYGLTSVEHLIGKWKLKHWVLRSVTWWALPLQDVSIKMISTVLWGILVIGNVVTYTNGNDRSREWEITKFSSAKFLSLSVIDLAEGQSNLFDRYRYILIWIGFELPTEKRSYCSTSSITKVFTEEYSVEKFIQTSSRRKILKLFYIFLFES